MKSLMEILEGLSPGKEAKISRAGAPRLKRAGTRRRGSFQLRRLRRARRRARLGRKRLRASRRARGQDPKTGKKARRS